MASTGILNAFEGSVVAPTADSTKFTADSTVVTADAMYAGDTAQFTGTALPGSLGVLAAIEGGDTAAFVGTASVPAVGTLSAVEVGADVASFEGHAEYPHIELIRSAFNADYGMKRSTMITKQNFVMRRR